MNALHGLIFSGDVFIDRAESLKYCRLPFEIVYWFKKNSGVIDYVCHVFGSSFVLVRSMSDTDNSNP